MSEDNEKTTEQLDIEQKQIQKDADLAYLANILPKVILAKEKLEQLRLNVDKYELPIVWGNQYDNGELEKCTSTLEEIINRLWTANKLY